MKNISLKATALIAIASILILAACKKSDYYMDGGLSGQSAQEKSMTTYDFLASRSNHMFDSLVKVIDLTNTKALVNQANITFYAASNSSVIRYQQRFKADDKLVPRPLEEIGKDTLTMLINRFIIPNAKITLEVGVQDKQKYYKANNGDSLFVFGKGGGITAGSSVQTSAFYMEYQHRKIPNVDTVVFNAGIQTHNLVTANAVVHVLSNSANFGAGMNQKFYR